MTPYETYVLYLAIKTHFTTVSYDFFKYNKSIKVKEETFNKRKDKIFFQKLALHPEVEDFLVANLSLNPKIYIRSLAYSEECKKTYKSWISKKLSLTYIFKNEVNTLQNNFNENIISKDNNHPILFKQYLADVISKETLCIILTLNPQIISYWDDKLKYDLLWQEQRLNIIKYIPFIDFDHEKFKKILLDNFI